MAVASVIVLWEDSKRLPGPQIARIRFRCRHGDASGITHEHRYFKSLGVVDRNEAEKARTTIVDTLARIDRGLLVIPKILHRMSIAITGSFLKNQSSTAGRSGMAEFYTAEDAWRVLGRGLVKVLADMERTIERWERAIEAGEAEQRPIYLNDGGALEGLARLHKLRRELDGKVEDVIAGVYRARPADLDTRTTRQDRTSRATVESEAG